MFAIDGQLQQSFKDRWRGTQIFDRLEERHDLQTLVTAHPASQ